MADELNTPGHRWYQPRNHIKLAKEDVSAQYIYDSGIQKIDAFIGRQPWGNPVPGLFALAEPGVWYDPSDLTTLFQDTAGTTPVTTPGQTVALALDKSKGLVLGGEQSPALSAYDTVLTGTWAASGANYIFTDTAGGQGRPGVQWPSISLVSGWYQLVVVVAAITGATQIRADGLGAADLLLNVGTNYRIVNVTSTSRPRFRLEDPSTTIGDGFTITSISVRELPGFHATQATAASRPTYGIVPRTGRRNLLERTEEFDNAAWVKGNVTVTANTSVAPDGTTTGDTLTGTAAGGITFRQDIATAAATVTLSFFVKAGTATACTIGDVNIGSLGAFNLSTGVVISGAGASIFNSGNGWYRCSVTYAPIAGFSRFTINPTSTYNANTATSILIWGAQLETGSTATAYQRVGSAFDVTEAGVPSLSYLSFDGVDDFLVTPTITPGIDKAQVFAGVRKLSDLGSLAAAIVESSVQADANNGALLLFGRDNFTPAMYEFGTRGTTFRLAGTNTSAFAAPVTNVLTGIGDISGDVARLRVNGSQVAETLTDQGTGNYLAYPLYIGRRAGTSLPFNGNIFSLVVRFGANLDTSTITNTETWVNGRTGAF